MDAKELENILYSIYRKGVFNEDCDLTDIVNKIQLDRKQYAETKVREYKERSFEFIDKRIEHISSLGNGYGINGKRISELKWCKMILTTNPKQ